MTDTPNTEPPLPWNEAHQTMLREMARDMDVALFRRYCTTDAAKLLGVSTKELEQLRTEGHIAYLEISGSHISFFGYQLLTYLLDCVVPVGGRPQAPTPEPFAVQPVPPTLNPAAELVSVNDALTALGIGRTKLYELINSREIESVKIGTRTLIKQTSLRRFTDPQSGRSS